MSTTEVPQKTQVKFQKLIEDANEAGIEYVIKRSFQLLPNKIYGDDIDVFVQDDHIVDFVDLALDRGFQYRTRDLSERSSTFLDYIRRSVARPQNAIQVLTDKQRRQSHIQKLLKNEEEKKLNRNKEARKVITVEHNGIDIQFENQLFHSSLFSDSNYRVHPHIEKEMLSSRRMHENGFYIPSPPDELLHLICRGVLDYHHRGDSTWPEYYKNRCDDLVVTIQESKEHNTRFRDLLPYVFFEADQLVLDIVFEQRYEDIRPELVSYAGY